MAMVLIYGASGGIGSKLARALAHEGYDLHLSGRDAARLSGLAEELGAGFTVADIEDAESFPRVSAAAGDRLDGLVYAVGSINLRPLLRLSHEDFVRDFRLNAEGAALAIQAAVPALKKAENGGSVVLFSSVAVTQGFSAHASISMAKGAVEGLTRALAAELAPRIRVNAVAPSLIETPLASALTANPQVAASIAQLHPMQRIGQPDDVASMTSFLLSEKSGWITGQVIGVDGGRSRLRTKG